MGGPGVILIQYIYMRSKADERAILIWCTAPKMKSKEN